MANAKLPERKGHVTYSSLSRAEVRAIDVMELDEENFERFVKYVNRSFLSEEQRDQIDDREALLDEIAEMEEEADQDIPWAPKHKNESGQYGWNRAVGSSTAYQGQGAFGSNSSFSFDKGKGSSIDLGKKTAPTQKCRHKATKTFTIDGIAYCGASEQHMINVTFEPSYLVVSLLGGSAGHVNAPGKWSDLERAGRVDHEFISIKWQDYKAPPVFSGFWKKLHQLALENKMTHVIFYCMGGHGRTGTALASMLVEVEGMSPKDAIAKVRQSYCSHAVESQSQEASLEALAKKKEGK